VWPALDRERTAASGAVVIRAIARVLARELMVLLDAVGELHSDRGLWGKLPHGR
jgi:hypothetical protein